MKAYPLKGFGKKLMVASKAVNTIPDMYMSYSRNARIYDGGIGPRRGKQLLTESTIGTTNKGGFTMAGNLYQIAGGTIYQVDKTTGVQLPRASIGHDSVTDIVTYAFPKGSFTSLGTQSHHYDYTIGTGDMRHVSRIAYDTANARIILEDFNGVFLDSFPIGIDNSLYNNRTIGLTFSGTTGSQNYGTGFSDGTLYYLQQDEYMQVSVPVSSGNPTLTIASPCVVTLVSHGLSVGDGFYFTTTGTLPTGVTAGNVYYVISTGFSSSSFQFSDSVGGAAINTSGTQSGTHTLFKITNQGLRIGDVQWEVGYFTETYKAIIASSGKHLAVFDGSSVFYPNTVPGVNSGIIEYCRGYTFLSSANTLYISRPIVPSNPEFSYDFTGTGSQQITYDTNIVGMIATMEGIYIFTEDKLEYLGANALQNVAGSATFISTPIGRGSQPINNLCIVADGEKVFYITKNLQVQTVNYIQGQVVKQIGELSARPVISIKEFMNTIDVNQPSSYAFLNETDKTIQMHIRSIGSPYNDYTLVYDLVNDTWNVDTKKNYNYIVKDLDKYYGFSDVNSSIYIDDVGFSDAGVPIEFRIDTQNINQGTPKQKLYGGFWLMGGIGALTTLSITANIDLVPVFQDSISGNPNNIPQLGEVGADGVGEDEVGGGLINYFPKLLPFDRVADEGRIYQCGKKWQFSFTSSSEIQDFIIDTAGIYYTPTDFIDINEVL